MAKHFLLYYKQGTGTIIVTEPRPWARENQHHFPDYDFINANTEHHPSTEIVEDYLIQHFHFQEYTSPNNSFKVLFNFDPTIDL